MTICGAGELVALHVDYGLRGEESAADADHVRALCARAGVALEVHRAPAPPAAGNRQAWARDLRYARAQSVARARGARVAAGHTASDQAETVLYRLAASPGRRALLGMAAADGLLIRPLLGVTREQTASYCRARGLAWREDASNGDGSYARGRCRHGLAAALGELHPAAEENILRSSELLREEAAVLDEVVETAVAGRRRIAVERLAALPPALARLVVVRLAEDALGALLPGVGGRLAELIGLAPAGGSAELDVGAGCRAVVEYGVLRFEAGAPEPVPAPVALAVPGTVGFGAWRVQAELGQGADAGLGRPAVADPGADPRRRWAGPGAGPIGPGLLDAAALEPGGLTVRGWRPGDRMAPLGLGGTKSLADLFADRRVPRAERRSLPVVTSAGEVAWIPGVATGERFRVGAATGTTVVLSARREPRRGDH
ncbi:MAG TPA: tRNA lysidine(34) synthetase TilS [Solirubrobacteraceae bacterium]|nr:tRNA lysidine(34) synthetase TilS [Solirubrobacteraceae bacterium]